MYKVEAMQSQRDEDGVLGGSLYAISDSTDETIDAITEEELVFLLKESVQLDGVIIDEDGYLVIADSVPKIILDVNGNVEVDEITGVDETTGVDDDDLYYGDDDNDEEYVYIDGLGTSDSNLPSGEDEDGDENEDYDEDEYEDVIVYTGDEDWGDDWEDDEYEDVLDEYESTVTNLYKLLSEDQVALLRMYYLWYSRKLFSEAQKDSSMGLTPSRLKRKKENLDQLRGKDGLWEYGGFIDTGYKGGGYCTLNHPLRYIHIAWDVTVSDLNETFFGQRFNDDDYELSRILESDHCIKFGIKCIADFFEVDKECVKSLQVAQREALKDMALMYEYYANGLDNLVLDRFKTMDSIVSRINKGVLLDKDFIPSIDKTQLSFYFKFRKSSESAEFGMLPPKSLVQELRDKLIGWENHKFTRCLRYPDRTIFIDNLVDLLGKKYKVVITGIISGNMQSLRMSSIKDILCAYLIMLVQYKSCGEYEYNADRYKDEGGKSQRAKSELLALHRLVGRLNDAREYTLEYARTLLDAYILALKLVDDGEWHLVQKVLCNSDGYYIISDVKTLNHDLLMSYNEELYSVSLFQESLIVNMGGLIRLLDKEDAYEAKNTLTSYVEIVSRYKDGWIAYSRSNAQERANELNAKIESYKKRVDEQGLATVTKVEEKVDAIEEIKTANDDENDLPSAYRAVSVQEIKGNVDSDMSNLPDTQLESFIASSPSDFSEEENKESPEVEEGGTIADDSDDFMSKLLTLDLSEVQGFEFEKKMLNQIVAVQNGIPSSKQRPYLQRLYSKATGIEIKEDKADIELLSDYPDLEVAIRYAIKNPSVVEPIVFSVCKSVLNYGKITSKQMVYIQKAKSVYETTL